MTDQYTIVVDRYAVRDLDGQLVGHVQSAKGGGHEAWHTTQVAPHTWDSDRIEGGPWATVEQAAEALWLHHRPPLCWRPRPVRMPHPDHGGWIKGEGYESDNYRWVVRPVETSGVLDTWVLLDMYPEHQMTPRRIGDTYLDADEAKAAADRLDTDPRTPA